MVYRQSFRELWWLDAGLWPTSTYIGILTIITNPVDGDFWSIVRGKLHPKLKLSMCRALSQSYINSFMKNYMTILKNLSEELNNSMILVGQMVLELLIKAIFCKLLSIAQKLFGQNLMPFLSFSDNLLQYANIIFQKVLIILRYRTCTIPQNMLNFGLGCSSPFTYTIQV